MKGAVVRNGFVAKIVFLLRALLYEKMDSGIGNKAAEGRGTATTTSSRLLMTHVSNGIQASEVTSIAKDR